MQDSALPNGTHDTEIWIGTSAWPAFRRDDATILVDFRLYDRSAPHPRLQFFPERLAEMNVPEEYIFAAAEGDGFVVLEH